MSVMDVRGAFLRAIRDQRFDEQDVDSVMESAGPISGDEEQALREGALQVDAFMNAAARSKLQSLLGAIGTTRSEARMLNQEVASAAPLLQREVRELLVLGQSTKTYGGTPLPEAVKQVVNRALEAGAVAYDVRERKADPVYDTEHGEPELIVDGKFNPYAQESAAEDSLAFAHTELTPGKIYEDMNTPQTYNVLAGYQTLQGVKCAHYNSVTAVGNGRISALYDEALHPDPFDRAPGGQKYANNFAILADGSVHCVPASRRVASEPTKILTTASLARGKLMLLNGHLNMERGVVTYVGVSGRLAKLARSGAVKWVDPIEILRAWGFSLAPGLRVTHEG